MPLTVAPAVRLGLADKDTQTAGWCACAAISLLPPLTNMPSFTLTTREPRSGASSSHRSPARKPRPATAAAQPLHFMGRGGGGVLALSRDDLLALSAEDLLALSPPLPPQNIYVDIGHNVPHAGYHAVSWRRRFFLLRNPSSYPYLHPTFAVARIHPPAHMAGHMAGHVPSHHAL